MVDVLVVGAGPAGAVAATVLARAGARVVVVDRARFPRPKLCGDTLNPGTVSLLRRLGLAGRLDTTGLRIDGMIVTGEGGVRVRGDYGGGWSGRAVSRRDLDAWLVEAAAAAGARVEEEVVARAPLFGDGPAGPEIRGVQLTLRDGRPLRLPAAVTIAADGRRSSLARGLGLVRHPARPRRWAAGAYFEDVAGMSSYGEMHIRQRHYFGVAPLPGGLVNACVVAVPGAGWEDPAALLGATLAGDPQVRDRFAGAHRVGAVAAIGPLAVNAGMAGMPGLLLAGDAAGFVDPMTGDGLRFAVRGGELAAEAALEMLRTGRRDGCVALTRRRAAEFGAKQRLNRALRALVGSAMGVRLAARGAAIAPAVVRRVIRIAGDLP